MNDHIDYTAAAIDVLAKMAVCEVGRLVDQDDGWALMDRGERVDRFGEPAVDLLILRGWIEDTTDDLMDEPVYAVSEAGRAVLSRFNAIEGPRSRARRTRGAA